MIQRVQSLYLLIAAILMGCMIFLPVAEFYGVSGGAGEDMELTAFGFRSISSEGDAVTMVSTFAMGIVIVASALLALVTIFLYKKRLLQLRLCLSEAILLIGAQIFVVLYTFRSVRSMEGFDDSIYSLKLPFFFPVIAILFVWLAIRGITKDIRLVKSLDRIR